MNNKFFSTLVINAYKKGCEFNVNNNIKDILKSVDNSYGNSMDPKRTKKSDILNRAVANNKISERKYEKREY